MLNIKSENPIPTQIEIGIFLDFVNKYLLLF